LKFSAEDVRQPGASATGAPIETKSAAPAKANRGERAVLAARHEPRGVAYAISFVMGGAVVSLARHVVQLDHGVIVRLAIATAPSVFDCAGLGEVDANIFDVGLAEHVGLK
jgi:hypothetical protein